MFAKIKKQIKYENIYKYTKFFIYFQQTLMNQNNIKNNIKNNMKTIFLKQYENNIFKTILKTI